MKQVFLIEVEIGSPPVSEEELYEYLLDCLDVCEQEKLKVTLLNPIKFEQGE